jgi:hypothetical protein
MRPQGTRAASRPGLRSGSGRSANPASTVLAFALALLALLPAQAIQAQIEAPEAVTDLSVAELVALYEAGLDAYLRYGHPEGRGISEASESTWDLRPEHFGVQVTSPVNLSRKVNEALGVISEKWEIPTRAERTSGRTPLGVSIPFVTEEGDFRFSLLVGHSVLTVVVERNEVGQFQGFWAPRRYTPPPGA